MATRETSQSPRVLLLKNYPSSSQSDTLIVDSFLTNIRNTAPSAQLDICCIANGEPVPNVSDYRLVILSGGKVNLLEDKKPTWVLQVLDMVRKVANDPTGPRLLGICWGHQAIHYALGGSLAWLEDGPRIGVQDVQLTEDGQREFDTQAVLKMHKYHVRYVSKLADDFALLARDNEIALSRSQRILTFQGHPEMTCEISRVLSEGDDGAYKPSAKRITNPEGDELLREISTPHDGEKIWRSILKWAAMENGAEGL